MPISNVSSSSRPGVCTSTTRPTTPFEGQMIYETDTDKTLQYNGSAWLENVKLDSAGRYRNTNQPMFFVSRHQGTSHSATSKMIFPHVVVNIGNHWDTVNNRFTAPVTGIYEFNYSILNTQTSGFATTLYKNGVAMNAENSPVGYSNYQYVSSVGVGILQLNANDYVELWVVTGIAHGYHNMFVGKLIG